MKEYLVEVTKVARKWVKAVDEEAAEEIAERVQVDIKHVNRFVMKEAKTFMKVYER